jgi:hypothetical protein
MPLLRCVPLLALPCSSNTRRVADPPAPAPRIPQRRSLLLEAINFLHHPRTPTTRLHLLRNLLHHLRFDIQTHPAGHVVSARTIAGGEQRRAGARRSGEGEDESSNGNGDGVRIGRGRCEDSQDGSETGSEEGTEAALTGVSSWSMPKEVCDCGGRLPIERTWDGRMGPDG